jgi:hypothetical protein
MLNQTLDLINRNQSNSQYLAPPPTLPFSNVRRELKYDEPEAFRASTSPGHTEHNHIRMNDTF